MQSIAALLLVVVAVANAENLLSHVAPQYQKHLSAQAKADLSKLTTKDITNLKEVASNAHKFTSLQAAREAAHKASPQAYAMAAKYGAQATILATAQYTHFKAKLAPQSQAMFGELYKLGGEFASKAHQVYQKQNANTKANLAQAFSYVNAAASTPAAQALRMHYQI
ncbi:hypothetical protein M3Y97_00612300 [Aphelenchoides bicaudatus]|nr:hypothetical protein M3Y97_00612300 [Aphelenchoides bicaudatus]